MKKLIDEIWDEESATGWNNTYLNVSNSKKLLYNAQGGGFIKYTDATCGTYTFYKKDGALYMQDSFSHYNAHMGTYDDGIYEVYCRKVALPTDRNALDFYNKMFDRATEV